MKYFKTIVKIEVLSSESPWAGKLSELDYDIREGDCSGVVLDSEITELTREEVHTALENQGSDPGFLDPMEEEDYLGDYPPLEMDAVRNVLGYLPSIDEIDLAISRCPIGSVQELKGVLKEKLQLLKKDSGADLIKDIDALRVTIAVREFKEAELHREFRNP
jgi:hypothetical protein